MATSLDQILGYGRDFAQGASNAVAGNVSGPVDGIAWLLKKAGLDVGEPVGGSDWMARKGLTAQPKNALAGLLGESVGMAGPMVAAAKAPQIAAGLNKMAANAAVRPTLNPQTGAIVWHGTPHKFDKFDSSKIGTGEGAQAYGHGLYLAESPKVATGYQKKLSDSQLMLGGKPFADQYDTLRPEFGNEVGALLEYAADNGLIGARQLLRSYIKDPSGLKYFGDPSIGPKNIEAVHKALKVLDDVENQTLGNLYKVDLPDEKIARMLDWDKPLSQQAPEVRAAMQRLVAQEVGPEKAAELMLRESFTGQNAMLHLPAKNSAGDSDLMRRAGIPGIRYLDGGSRGAGSGTSNFVVFPGEENVLRILERNGQQLP